VAAPLDWEYWEGQFLAALIAIAVVTAVVVVVLVVTLVRKHRQVNRPETPLPVKLSYYASIAYAVFPVDLLPDPLLIDDIGVLAAALVYVSRALRRLRAKPTGERAPHRPDELA
jgi:uncharacterized membrane protein YkvA (DUF1232 family)